MGATLLRQRTTIPGTVLEVMVLASGRRSCIGVDLDSGAFVRTIEPAARDLLDRFSVIRGRTAGPALDRPEQPELVRFHEPLTRIGQIHPRRANRLLRPLLHPRGQPLLGFYGPSTPWWEHETAPSVAVVEVGRSFQALVTARGLRARFTWNGQSNDLPLEDLHVLSQLDWHSARHDSVLPVRNIVGFEPSRVVVAMGRPKMGYCAKVVAGLLP